MKFLVSLILFAGIAAQAQNNLILQWEPTLPLEESQIAQLIQAKAFEDYYYESDDKACGGEITAPALVDYYTYISSDSSLVHKLKIQVTVTGSYNYCQQTTLSVCTIPVTMKSEKAFGMGKWDCTVVGIKD